MMEKNSTNMICQNRDKASKQDKQGIERVLSKKILPGAWDIFEIT